MKLKCEHADCTNAPQYACDYCDKYVCAKHAIIDKLRMDIDADEYKLIPAQNSHLCHECAEGV